MKIAVLTCSIGDNCNFKKLQYREEGVDYFYLSDNQKFIDENQTDNSGYKFMHVDNKYQDDAVCKGSRKLAKRIKIRRNEFISEYDWVVWIDGHKQIKNKKCGIKNYISRIPENIDIVFKPHPCRDTVFQELEECKSKGIENPITIDAWKLKIINEGFDKTEHRLLETDIVFFRSIPNNIPDQFYEDWWYHSTHHLCRDQLTLNYFIWKYDLNKYIKIDNDMVPKNFKLRNIGKTVRGRKEWTLRGRKDWDIWNTKDLSTEDYKLEDWDWARYLDTYPDLTDAGITTHEDARTHWLRHGIIEGHRTLYRLVK